MRTAVSGIIVFCVAMFAAGCTLQPTDTGGGAPAVTDTGFWPAFNDPLLTAFVTDALRNNPDLRSASAAFDAARARRTAARAGWFPSLNANVSASDSKTGSTTSTRNSVGVDASWEPDLTGSTRSTVNAADADLAAAKNSLAAAQVSLAAEVALAYLDVRGLQARRDIAAGNLDAQSQTLDLTQWRAQAGLVSSLDVDQARANREQTRAQLATIDASLAKSMHNLAILTGRKPGELDDTLAERKPVPGIDNGHLPDVMPADLLRNRPDVQAAERRVAAESARVRHARAARYPNFRLSGSVGRQAAGAAAFSGGGSGISSLLAGISLPLLDAGRLRAEVAAQLAVREQVLAAYDAAVLAALADVEDSLASVKGAHERVAALRAAAEAATNAATLAQQRYAAGSIDFQSVLDTQRTAFGIEDNLATAGVEAASAQIRLYKALGGGWHSGNDPGKPDAAVNEPESAP